jgi:hypothetical protein
LVFALFFIAVRYLVGDLWLGEDLSFNIIDKLKKTCTALNECTWWRSNNDLNMYKQNNLLLAVSIVND